MLSSFFGSEGSSTLQFALIFAVIVVLLAVLVLVVQRLTRRGLGLGAKAGQRGRQPRLGIVDVYELDRQRQLILLRRDNVEHLLLVGGPNDVMVERNITRDTGARLPVELGIEARTENDPEPAAAPARMAPAFQPPPFPEAPYRAPREPTFEMPVVLPPPLPGSATPPLPVGRPLEVPSSGPEPDDPEPEIEAETKAPAPPPEPAPPTRLFRRTPPPLVNPRPDVASERSRVADMPAANAEPEPAPPPAMPPPARAVDAAILSDMARQLEEALRRPATPAAPPPALPEPVPATTDEPAASESAPEPVLAAPEPPAAPERAVDPLAAAMAGSQDLSRDEGLFAYEEQTPAPPEPPPPAPVLEPAPEPAAPIVPPPPPAPKPSSQNPFSVEEIEAEFARLLGRPLDKKG